MRHHNVLRYNSARTTAAMFLEKHSENRRVERPDEFDSRNKVTRPANLGFEALHSFELKPDGLTKFDPVYQVKRRAFE